jgi:hypothetical protein
LKGLPQYDQAIYGRGQRRKGASSSDTATLANTASDPSALVIDDEGSLEPGGVELNVAEWFHEAMELAMAVTEDEPTLQEALEGSERQE